MQVYFVAISLLDKWRIFKIHLTSFLSLRGYLQTEKLDNLCVLNMTRKHKFYNIWILKTMKLDFIEAAFPKFDEEEIDKS